MHKKIFGFSVLELMIMLIAVSVVVAAITPIITRSVKNNKTIMNASQITRNCMPGCSLCQKTVNGKRCFVCNIKCPDNQSINKETCSCSSCQTKFGDACVSCNTMACTECKPGYTIENGKCVLCQNTEENNNKYSGFMCNGKTKVECTKGTVPSLDKTSCVQCPEGQIAQGDKCITCENGSYADKNQEQCIYCETGYYCSDGKKEACPKGSSNNMTNQPNCVACDDGYFQDKVGQTSCEPCPIGTYSGSTSGNLFEQFKSHAQCTSCPNGTYSDTIATKKCKTNTALNCHEYSKTSNTCVSCKAGYGYYNGICKSCAEEGENAYANEGTTGPCINTNIQNCTKTNNETGLCSVCNKDFEVVNGKCVACKEDYYSTNGITCYEKPAEGCAIIDRMKNVCITCQSNRVMVNGKCVLCGEGYKSNGANYCVPINSCKPGTKLNSDGTCTQCDPGTYSQYNNVSTCTNCAPGTYQIKSGQSSCVPCDANCAECDPQTGFCITCKDAMKPNQTTGLCEETTTPCEINNCLECNIDGTKCIQCKDGYMPKKGDESKCVLKPGCMYYTAYIGENCTKCNFIPSIKYGMMTIPVCQACKDGSSPQKYYVDFPLGGTTVPVETKKCF